jgi:hypothetical protein
MDLNKYRNSIFALGLTFALGCGGGDGGSVGNADDNSDTNGNNTSTNGATNGDPNNGNSNNGTPNGETNGETNGNPNAITGLASFAQPTEETVYTNGDLLVEAAAEGDVEDLELVLDDEEVLATFDGSTEYTWDTTSRDEGSYELMLRYTLGGAVRWSDDARTVIVDRTAPTLAESSPAANAEGVASDAAITLTFSEALDPASVDPTTVGIEFNGSDTTDHTVELSEDGLTVTIDFDRATVPTPYNALVSVDGVTDLAGNAMNTGYGFEVPAWKGESFSASLTEPEWLSIGGSEYVVGTVQGVPDDYLRIYKSDGAGTWDEVVDEPLSAIYDVAIDKQTDVLYLAVLHRTTAGQLLVKGAELFEFDPASDELTSLGSQVVGPDTNDGAIDVDIRNFPGETVGAVATVSDEDLRVFEFDGTDLSSQTQNTFPTGDYNYVRDESLSLFMRSDGNPEVVFARCSGSSNPCVRTFVERAVSDGTTWEEYVGSTSTPYSASASDCDEFVNFETVYLRDALTLFFAYHAPCSAPEPALRNLDAGEDGWDNIAGASIVSAMPGGDDAAYSAHAALGAENQLHVLLASAEYMMIARYGTDTIGWLPEIETGLTFADNVQQRIRHPRLFMTGDDRPLVLFRHSNTIQIWRRN